LIARRIALWDTHGEIVRTCFDFRPQSVFKRSGY
jgi:hypothetical protein